MAAIQVRARKEGDDVNTTDEIVLYRPVLYTDDNTNLHVLLEQLLYWKAGSKPGTDANDPRKTAVPVVTGDWIFVLGGPLSRPHDADIDITYNFNALPSPEYQDISMAYYIAYAAHEEYIKQTMLLNPTYALQRNTDWFTSNPPTNDEAFVEVPLPVEAVPPVNYGV